MKKNLNYMKILFIITSFNSLSQKVYVELKKLDHVIHIEYFINENYIENIKNKISNYNPDMIICPFLTKKIPEEIYNNYLVLILHPGIPGDAGPSSLDWAIYYNEELWGVTLLKADNEFDKGPIVDYKIFNMPKRENLTKSSLYRKEIVDASKEIIINTVNKYTNCKKIDFLNIDKKGKSRPLMNQKYRKVDFNANNTNEIFKNINMSDSQPGVLINIKCVYNNIKNTYKFILSNNLDKVNDYYMYGAHIESLNYIINYDIYKNADIGEIFMQRDHAICIKTKDSALWVTHLRKSKNKNDNFKGLYVKLPAIYSISKFNDKIFNINKSHIIYNKKLNNTFQEIYYEINGNVSNVYFNFYNGAMSTYQCRKMIHVLNEIINNDEIKIVVLFGGNEYFSNGINLCTIQESFDPSIESWKNINAINDIVEIILTSNKYFISAIKGNCGAGGVTMAISSDYVISKESVIFNMHYKGMGLYGSEYWTYILPKRIGKKKTKELVDNVLPIDTIYAKKIGLIDEYINENSYAFEQDILKYINSCIINNINILIEDKKKTINEDFDKIQKCRYNELKIMKENFFDKNSSYHELRSNFVKKINPLKTPNNISLPQSNEEDIIYTCLIKDK